MASALSVLDASLSSSGLAAGWAVVGCAVASFAVYLLLLACAALIHRPRPRTTRPRDRLIVVIPAHDEAILIGRCVASLRSQAYPRGLYEIVVIADNCSDDTAVRAAAAGAHRVFIRDQPDARGKGRALAWAIERLLAEDQRFGGLVVVDADSIADPDFLAMLVRPFEAGAQAVQGESLLYGDGSPSSALRVAAFLLVNRVRPAGRAALGLPATHLAGNGMLLSRELLIEKPWGAFSSAEDLEYSLELQRAGQPIAFAAGAIVRSPSAPNPQAAVTQQLRWEGGKLHLARTHVPRLLSSGIRARRPALLGTAFDLLTPPLGFLAAALSGGVLAGTAAVLDGALPWWATAPWWLGDWAVGMFVLIGLRAAHASRAEYGALRSAPAFLIRKVLGVRRLLDFDADTWVRTERAAGTDPSRSER